MKKIVALTVLFVAVLFGVELVQVSRTLLAADNKVTWKGYVTDTWCGVNRDTKPPSAECTNECLNTKKAKLAFYNLADKNVYILNPPDAALKYAGQLVTITGTIGSDTQKFDTMRGPSEAKTLTIASISE